MNSLQQILQVKKNRFSWLSYVALMIGFLLLLLTAQLYLDANRLLSNPQQKEDGFEYLVVNKKITNEMMGDNTRSYFSDEEITQCRNQQAVNELGLIISNRYSITANTLGQLAFSTQLFFESVPEPFMDIHPEGWHWKQEDQKIPIILSADYLNLYNFGFALSQGLPQMSEETIRQIPFNVTIYDQQHEAHFVANVVGFTQRYSSVLVPAEFMQYANEAFGNTKANAISRLIIKTKEPDQPALVKFLEEHDYSTQNEKLKSSKLKTITNTVFAICGFVGVFVLLLSFILLLMYLKLMIIESGNKLQLLSILGYSPKVLQTQYSQRSIQLLLGLIVLALILTAACQYVLSVYLKTYALHVSVAVSWQVIVLALLLSGLVIYLIRSGVANVILKVLR